MATWGILGKRDKKPLSLLFCVLCPCKLSMALESSENPMQNLPPFVW